MHLPFLMTSSAEHGRRRLEKSDVKKAAGGEVRGWCRKLSAQVKSYSEGGILEIELIQDFCRVRVLEIFVCVWGEGRECLY